MFRRVRHRRAEIEKTMDRKVWPGEVAVTSASTTEALVAIDVNTGRFTGKKNQEDTHPEDQPGGGGRGGPPAPGCVIWRYHRGRSSTWSRSRRRSRY
ncbi:MAG: ribonuclease E/G [Candidatus Eisenbacteria bacterium]|nr:ribonuclease E/G [Candidatus Eisenbacteria bacterium]